MVLWAHYVGIFQLSDIQSIFPYMLPRSQATTTFFNNIVVAFESEMINFGALGVSIFFLITGFLTAQSLDKDNHATFIVKRVFRIYPAYIVGTAILYVTTLIYTKWSGSGMPWRIRDFVIQASLFRDWFWIPSVDQIGWTLEVQMKMYLVYFVLHRMRVLYNGKASMLIAAICTVFLLGVWPYSEALAVNNWRAYTILYVIIFSIVFLIFGMIGVTFYQYYCGRWSAKESAVIGGFLLLCFWLCVDHSVLAGGSTLRSYLAGTTIFGAAFTLRNRLHCREAVSFIAKISFSFYIVHGLNGYYLLSVLDYYQVNPYIALFITGLAALLAACGLYWLVEKPSAAISKRMVQIRKKHVEEGQG